MRTFLGLVLVVVAVLGWSACGSSEDAPSEVAPTVTLPAGTVWRFSDPVNSPEEAIAKARDSFTTGTNSGEITSMSLVETTMGEARPIFNPTQSIQREWLSDSPDDHIAWVVQAEGSFGHFTMGAEPHNTSSTVQTALIPKGIDGFLGGPDAEDNKTDLHALGDVVEVPLPLAEFPFPIQLSDPDLVGHIVIPDLDVDAPVFVRTKDANEVMEEPNGPDSVAWYDFTARPGEGTNIVLAGYTWYEFLGRGVLRGLRELSPGATIGLSWNNQEQRNYQVISYDAPDPALHADEIVGSTTVETITLIGAYDGTEPPQRTIIRAELIE